MHRSIITPEYHQMYAFRRWAEAVSTLAKGYFACLNNVIDGFTDKRPLQYDVTHPFPRPVNRTV